MRDQEEQERMKALNEELIQYKVSEILACVEDNAMFLKHEWIPFGSFLKIFKIHFQTLHASEEFLITKDTDELKIITEILEWLESERK